MAGVRLSGGADISSAYLWRGERVCGLHLYPELALTTGNFTFMAYGYFPFDGLYAERDIEASYRIRNVSLHTACYFVYMSHEETQPRRACHSGCGGSRFSMVTILRTAMRNCITGSDVSVP